VWWNLVSVFSCLLARLNKTPVILTPRGTLSNYSFGNRNAGIKYYIHRFIGKSLLEYCHIQVTSKKEEQAVLALVKPKSITVIPNFVYLPEMETGQNNNSPANTDSHTIKLLFLSRVEEKKGLDLLFSALAECNFNFQLTIAGTGNPNYITYLKDLLKQLKIEAYIEWIGQQNQKEKWDVLQRHDLMILPSHDENFANVVIECLATGTPVLISNKVGLADYIQSQNFGWICNVDKDSIKENLLLFKAQPQKAALIRQIAPEKIRVDFDEKQLVKQFLKLYSDISKAE
jgi:glycosyltransferase involved in cell wall biosynthesis